MLRALQRIWYVTLVREAATAVLRTRAAMLALALVADDIDSGLPPGGVVITTCHTPWMRLLAAWCRAREFSLVVAGGRWGDIAGTGVAIDHGVSPCRRLIQHLRAGGRVIVFADSFHDHKHCATVEFLGTTRIASLLPARLAAAAGVPLVAAMPVLTGNRIRAFIGAPIPPDAIVEDPASIIRDVLRLFEHRVREEPGRRSGILRELAAR